MKLDVSKAFVRPTERFEFEMDVELETQEVNGDQVSFDPVHLKGEYSMTDDEVRVEGTLSTIAHAPCALCLETASAAVEVDFGESFRRDADEEDGYFRYEGKQLPLDHMVLTLVMLNLPMRFQCETQCSDGAGLTAWNEQDTVWAEEDAGDSQGTYRPFEGLAQLLEDSDDLQQ